jgi:hypothetical protein
LLPEPKPNSALEAALREVLFPARIDDGESHGSESATAFLGGNEKDPHPNALPCGGIARKRGVVNKVT